MGGPNTCRYSCMMLGYRTGLCDEEFKCNCGGGNNRWGNMLQNAWDRF